MSDRWKRVWLELLNTVKYAQMEMFISLVFFVLWIIFKNMEEGYRQDHILSLFPLFLTLTFVCNKLFKKGLWRTVYYLSGFLFLAFICVNVRDFSFSTGYFFSLLIAFLSLISCVGGRENVRYANNAMRVFLNLLSGFFIAYALCLAVCAIYASFVYIFNIDIFGSFDFYDYVLAFSGFVSTPLAFIYFNRKERSDKFNASGVFNVLMNFILSPAVIIYTVILYVYFAKITVFWELPKGNVAYMVFAFILSVVVGQACQPLLKRSFYDLFYRCFSYISLPPLAMFWVGVVYRVREYGFTEDRVYLVLLGGLTTLCMLLFLNKTVGRYLYVALTSVFILSLFTFIPACSAKRIGIYSQTERLDKVILQLGLADSDGHIKKKHPANDTIHKKEYKELFEIFQYVAKETEPSYMEERYGIDNTFDLKTEVIPSVLEDYVAWGGSVKEQVQARFVSLGVWADPGGFKYLYDFDDSSGMDGRDVLTGEAEYSYIYIDGKLVLKGADRKILLELNMNVYFNDKLKGMENPQRVFSADMSDDNRRELMYLDTDFGRIVFKTFQVSGDSIYKVENVLLNYLLTNKK